MRAGVAWSLALVPLLCGGASASPQLWDVYTRSGAAFARVAVDRYEADSLYVWWVPGTIAIPQDSIRSIVRKGGSSHVGTGLLLGAAAGGLVAAGITMPQDPIAPIGAIISAPYVMGARLLAVVIGSVLGGAVGSASGADTEYRMDRMSRGKRRAVLSELFPGGDRAESREVGTGGGRDDHEDDAEVLHAGQAVADSATSDAGTSRGSSDALPCHADE